MKVLLGLPDADLAEQYREPRTPWWRANMVTTVDGSVAGADGRSGSINDTADHEVFEVLRAWADVIVVGAGTARAEQYGVADVPLVLVSRRGVVPDQLVDAPHGLVVMATTVAGARAASETLPVEHVIVCGEDSVDLRVLREHLLTRGHQRVLCEGGPSLLTDALDQGVVDELDATVVPRLVGGEASRMATGPALDVPLTLAALLEHDGTLLARWLVQPRNK
ncbi:MAG: dihydrofolate reductase family protein [Nocardioides sp.]